MRTRRNFMSAILILAALGLSIPNAGAQAQPPLPAIGANLGLTTPAFEDGSVIPARYTHSVANPVSPRLQWSNVPDRTVSFVVIVHDLDVTINKKADDALHWLAFNIPGTSRELPEAVPNIPQLADGTIQIKTLRDMVGYMGPGAPPPAYHHYTFELYALDAKLSLRPDATRADVFKAMEGHILGKGVVMGRFHR